MGPKPAPAGCGGSSLVTACTVSLETLRAAPYSFVDADPINFKVTATNKWGTSPDSQIGSGAIMIINAPYAPNSLAEVNG